MRNEASSWRKKEAVPILKAALLLIWTIIVGNWKQSSALEAVDIENRQIVDTASFHSYIEKEALKIRKYNFKDDVTLIQSFKPESNSTVYMELRGPELFQRNGSDVSRSFVVLKSSEDHSPIVDDKRTFVVLIQSIESSTSYHPVYAYLRKTFSGESQGVFLEHYGQKYALEWEPWSFRFMDGKNQVFGWPGCKENAFLLCKNNPHITRSFWRKNSEEEMPKRGKTDLLVLNDNVNMVCEECSKIPNYDMVYDILDNPEQADFIGTVANAVAIFHKAWEVVQLSVMVLLQEMCQATVLDDLSLGSLTMHKNHAELKKISSMVPQVIPLWLEKIAKVGTLSIRKHSGLSSIHSKSVLQEGIDILQKLLFEDGFIDTNSWYLTPQTMLDFEDLKMLFGNGLGPIEAFLTFDIETLLNLKTYMWQRFAAKSLDNIDIQSTMKDLNNLLFRLKGMNKFKPAMSGNQTDLKDAWNVIIQSKSLKLKDLSKIIEELVSYLTIPDDANGESKAGYPPVLRRHSRSLQDSPTSEKDPTTLSQKHEMEALNVANGIKACIMDLISSPEGDEIPKFIKNGLKDLNLKNLTQQLIKFKYKTESQQNAELLIKHVASALGELIKDMSPGQAFMCANVLELLKKKAMAHIQKSHDVLAEVTAKALEKVDFNQIFKIFLKMKQKLVKTNPGVPVPDLIEYSFLESWYGASDAEKEVFIKELQDGLEFLSMELFHLQQIGNMRSLSGATQSDNTEKRISSQGRSYNFPSVSEKFLDYLRNKRKRRGAQEELHNSENGFNNNLSETKDSLGAEDSDVLKLESENPDDAFMDKLHKGNFLDALSGINEDVSDSESNARMFMDNPKYVTSTEENEIPNETAELPTPRPIPIPIGKGDTSAGELKTIELSPEELDQLLDEDYDPGQGGLLEGLLEGTGSSLDTALMNLPGGLLGSTLGSLGGVLDQVTGLGQKGMLGSLIKKIVPSSRRRRSLHFCSQTSTTNSGTARKFSNSDLEFEPFQPFSKQITFLNDIGSCEGFYYHISMFFLKSPLQPEYYDRLFKPLCLLKKKEKIEELIEKKYLVMDDNTTLHIPDNLSQLNKKKLGWTESSLLYRALETSALTKAIFSNENGQLAFERGQIPDQNAVTILIHTALYGLEEVKEKAPEHIIAFYRSFAKLLKSALVKYALVFNFLHLRQSSLNEKRKAFQDVYDISVTLDYVLHKIQGLHEDVEVYGSRDSFIEQRRTTLFIKTLLYCNLDD